LMIWWIVSGLANDASVFRTVQRNVLAKFVANRVTDMGTKKKTVGENHHQCDG
jgi:hypothetical protein